jgi:hypothetical protein
MIPQGLDQLRLAHRGAALDADVSRSLRYVFSSLICALGMTASFVPLFLPGTTLANQSIPQGHEVADRTVVPSHGNHLEARSHEH